MVESYAVPKSETFESRWEGGGPDVLPPPAAPFDVRPMADLQARKTAETTRTTQELEQNIDQDRVEIRKAFDATGIGQNELQPFDQQREREKFMHSPVEAFGSLGSVFAMVASAFTRQPVINSLNAAAGAMNALKKSDEAEYQKSFDAWKANTDLAIKRHNLQHQHYEDAIQLMNVDQGAATAKLRAQAARFGDQQALMLLDTYGISKELLELQQTRDKTMQGIVQTREMMTAERFKSTLVQKAIDAGEDPEEVFSRFYGKGQMTAEGQALRQLYREKGAKGEEVTSEDISKLHQNFMRTGAATPQKIALDRFFLEKPDASPEEIATFMRSLKTDPNKAPGGATNLTVDRQIAADVAAARQRWKSEGMSDEEIAKKSADMAAELRTKSAGMSGNQRDQIHSAINRVDYSIDTIGKVEGLLKKHNAITGLGGKITRPMESVANAIGLSNRTDRRQFESYISELQEWAGRLMNETKGRPLASEASKINTIVRGLNMGDTVANTTRALKEVKELYLRMRADLKTRAEGTFEPGDREKPGAGSTESSGAKQPAWKSAPKVE